MTISVSSSSPGAAATSKTNVSGQIAQLQSQLKGLTKKLKETSDSDMEAKMKAQIMKMLQAQIAAVQAQIQSLQQQQNQAKLPSKDAAQSSDKQNTEQASSVRRSNLSTLGSQVDTYV